MSAHLFVRNPRSSYKMNDSSKITSNTSGNGSSYSLIKHWSSCLQTFTTANLSPTTSWRLMRNLKAELA